MFARDRADEVLALGLEQPWFRDLYHFALRMPWWRFLLSVVLLYGGFNAVFALLYLILRFMPAGIMGKGRLE